MPALAWPEFVLGILSSYIYATWKHILICFVSPILSLIISSSRTHEQMLKLATSEHFILKLSWVSLWNAAFEFSSRFSFHILYRHFTYVQIFLLDSSVKSSTMKLPNSTSESIHKLSNLNLSYSDWIIKVKFLHLKSISIPTEPMGNIGIVFYPLLFGKILNEKLISWKKQKETNLLCY